jgi:oligosaccharide repeat unit polymerase
MSIVVCTLFVVTLAYAIVTNADLFSPAKLYLLSFMIFYFGALTDDSKYQLWLLVLIVLMVGMIAVLFEALSPVPRVSRLALKVRRRDDPVHFVMWIWVLSLPGILAEAYLIHNFGGLQGYVDIIGNRVIELRGFGWATTLIATLTAINLAYFAVGLTQRRTKLWWCWYWTHLLVVVVTGLLSGSRGGVLTIFVMQLFCYHYLRKNVRLARAATIAAAMLACAMILGVIRQGVKFEGDTFTTGLAQRDSVVEFSTIHYGENPLQLLLDADDLHLAYGTTFLSLLTNVIPRDWWPDKPDTGGGFFTKVYTGDAWNGASNLAPTYLGEWIMNFGWALGIAFFVVTYPALMYFCFVYYRRVILRVRTLPAAVAALDLALYVMVLWAIVALMTGEVTNVLLSLVLTRIAPLVILRTVLDRQASAVRHVRRGNLTAHV